MTTSLELKLSGFNYEDIYAAECLPILDRLFLDFIGSRDDEMAARFRTYRKGENTAAVAESELLINAARYLEDFLVDAFGVEAARNALRRQQLLDDPIHAFKEKFVKPHVRRKYPTTQPFTVLDELLGQKLDSQPESDRELAVARLWVLATESESDHGEENSSGSRGPHEEASHQKGQAPPSGAQRPERWDAARLNRRCDAPGQTGRHRRGQARLRT